MKRIVIASENSGKIAEFNSLFLGVFEVLPLNQFCASQAEENGDSFVENALIKARYASKISDLPAIADDSGLCVMALQDAPGICSSRYSQQGGGYIYDERLSVDENNNIKLLQNLEQVNERDAYFYCALVYIEHWQDPTPVIHYGRWDGSITRKPKGEGGFGYDSLFYIKSLSKSAAQLDGQYKNTISHRGQAVKKMVNELSK